LSDRFSPNGAVILTGKGLQSVRDRIRQAFQGVHHSDQPVAPPKATSAPHPAPVLPPVAPTQYNERHAKAFAIHSKVLASAAVMNPNVVKSTAQRTNVNGGAWEIKAPTESYEELIKAATETLRKP
jgi:hypothetical protein